MLSALGLVVGIYCMMMVFCLYSFPAWRAEIYFFQVDRGGCLFIYCKLKCALANCFVENVFAVMQYMTSWCCVVIKGRQMQQISQSVSSKQLCRFSGNTGNVVKERFTAKILHKSFIRLPMYFQESDYPVLWDA